MHICMMSKSKVEIVAIFPRYAEIILLDFNLKYHPCVHTLLISATRYKLHNGKYTRNQQNLR